MNILYIGLENPFSIAVYDTPLSQVSITAIGGGISIDYDTTENMIVGFANVTTPGEATISVFAENKKVEHFKFNVKRIPDPFFELNLDCMDKRGGQIQAALFRTLTTTTISMENFYYETQCQVQSFNITRARKGQDSFSINNSGAKLNAKALEMVRSAQIGDIFYFDEVRTRCPGDAVGREVNSLVFKII